MSSKLEFINEDGQKTKITQCYSIDGVKYIRLLSECTNCDKTPGWDEQRCYNQVTGVQVPCPTFCDENGLPGGCVEFEECVEPFAQCSTAKSLYTVVDNTGTRYQWDAEIEVHFTDGTTTVITQTPTTGWTNQLNQWATIFGDTLATKCGDYLSEPRCNVVPGGCGGLLPPPSFLHGKIDEMRWRYLQITTCADCVTISAAFVISVNGSPLATPRPLVLKYIEGEEEYFEVCKSCGEEGKLFYYGTSDEVAEADIPICLKPCGYVWPDIPLPLCTNEVLPVCDDGAPTEEVYAVVTDCEGLITVQYMTPDPADPQSLIEYTPVGNIIADGCQPCQFSHTETLCDINTCQEVEYRHYTNCPTKGPYEPGTTNPTTEVGPFQECPEKKLLAVEQKYDIAGQLWTLFSKCTLADNLCNSGNTYTDIIQVGSITSGSGTVHPAGPDAGSSIDGWNVFTMCSATQPSDDGNGHYWITGSSNDYTLPGFVRSASDSVCGCVEIQEIKEYDPCLDTETYRYVIEDGNGNLIEYIPQGTVLNECPKKEVIYTEKVCYEDQEIFTIENFSMGGDNAGDPNSYICQDGATAYGPAAGSTYTINSVTYEYNVLPSYDVFYSIDNVTHLPYTGPVVLTAPNAGTLFQIWNRICAISPDGYTMADYPDCRFPGTVTISLTDANGVTWEYSMPQEFEFCGGGGGGGPVDLTFTRDIEVIKTVYIGYPAVNIDCESGSEVDVSAYDKVNCPIECCPVVREAYACINGEKRTIEYGVYPDTGNYVGWFRDISTGTMLTGAPVWVDECAPCAIAPRCIQLFAFDNDTGLLTPGDFTEYELFIDGVLHNTIVHDYSTTSNGTDKSTWYDPIIAAINALPGWSMSVNTDVALPSNGKVLWDINYTGANDQQLIITKGPMGGATPDRYIIDIIGSSITGITDDNSSGNPFGSEMFQSC